MHRTVNGTNGEQGKKILSTQCRFRHTFVFSIDTRETAESVSEKITLGVLANGHIEVFRFASMLLEPKQFKVRQNVYGQTTVSKNMHPKKSRLIIIKTLMSSV